MDPVPGTIPCVPGSDNGDVDHYQDIPCEGKAKARYSRPHNAYLHHAGYPYNTLLEMSALRKAEKNPETRTAHLNSILTARRSYV
jgi:hypothetical protein